MYRSPTIQNDRIGESLGIFNDWQDSRFSGSTRKTSRAVDDAKMQGRGSFPFKSQRRSMDVHNKFETDEMPLIMIGELGASLNHF